MSTLSGEEKLNRRIKILGEDNGRYFDSLENEVYRARLLWREYKALFSESKERVDLLNEVSGRTAFWIERCMFESLMFTVCRMSDPEKQKGRTNVTVLGLETRLSTPGDIELTHLIKSAEAATKFARDWRNKRLGHNDFLTLTGVHKIEDTSIIEIRKAIDALARCIQRFALLELDTTLITHPVSTYGHDAVDLLSALHLGHIEMNSRRELRKKAVEERRFKDAEDLDILPSWLTYRPQDERDI